MRLYLLYVCSAGHLMCAEAGPEGGDACSAQVRARAARCPVCRQALADTPIRALAVEHSIAALPAVCRQGLTLVNFSAQLKRILWDRGACRGCLGGV
jgi:hypothetical protein